MRQPQKMSKFSMNFHSFRKLWLVEQKKQQRGKIPSYIRALQRRYTIEFMNLCLDSCMANIVCCQTSLESFRWALFADLL